VTLTRTIEPGRCAVTTTPSIFPSACEPTVPVSAGWPGAGTAGGENIAAADAASARISLPRIRLSRCSLGFAYYAPGVGVLPRSGTLRRGGGYRHVHTRGFDGLRSGGLPAGRHRAGAGRGGDRGESSALHGMPRR